MYQVKFRTSGIVAFSSTDRGVCQHWLECNDYGPETPYTDPDTGEIDPSKWVRGDCLNLFVIKRVSA